MYKKVQFAIEPHLLSSFWESSFGKTVFSYAANRALKIIGKIFKFRAGLNTVIGIAELFIVLPTANVANVFHIYAPFNLFYYQSLLPMAFQTSAARAAPANGPTINTQTLVNAAPPAKIAGPKLLAGFTEVPVK